MRVKELFAFMRERHAVYKRKTNGLARPWSNDPILNTYRFCNVYRELDAVTIWIAKNWRDKHQGDKNLWFAMVVARLFNNPATLDAIEYPVPFNPGRIEHETDLMKHAEMRVFNPAYIVSTNGVAMDKVEYILTRVLKPLWEARDHMTPYPTECLSLWHEALSEFNGMGSFLASQVIADLKYAAPYHEAPDWWTFATSGPGSRRGLNRVCSRAVDKRWSEDAWYNTLVELSVHIAPLLKKADMPRIHNQDLQNCLCEFDKYERARLGEGRPKQLYK